MPPSLWYFVIAAEWTETSSWWVSTPNTLSLTKWGCANKKGRASLLRKLDVGLSLAITRKDRRWIYV